ncbi:ABC transporter permease [Ectobacillus ponti]|uniref:ABC transporter permease subunit n=1 Tax=Ectobacillus ponti TaxID=2961894 RepID=A0AA42BUY6_9BACI|nr:ABC transporter permease subunit [Ectobacillus ponti]MCP8971023.1 ABC transporter permease subunit [Ectobacillus ponti]
MSRTVKQSLLGGAMVLPSFLTLVVLVMYPVIVSIGESFKDQKGGISLSNYTYLFSDPAMLRNMQHTLFVTLVSSILVLCISYAMAVYMRFGSGWAVKIVRRLYILPMFVPGIIAVYGVINMYRDNGWMARIIGKGVLPPIIYDVKGVILLSIWFHIPFTAMLLHSALTAIPASVIESAKDIGAGKLRVFFHFIMPLTMKTMLVAFTFLFMGIIGSFTVPFLVDKNAPQMYGVAMEQHFSSYHELGKASSMAVVLFLICAAVGYVYIQSMMKEDKRGL